MKILIGVVTYNPDLSNYKAYIRRLKSQGAEGILFVDNDSDNVNELRSVLAVNSIGLIENSENYGIAKALNQIVAYAHNNSYDAVMTLDQDSDIPDELLVKLKRYLKYDNVGIVCPQIFNLNTKQYDIVTEEVINLDENANYVTKCINSGALIKTAVWEKIGGFDEYLFMDGVDFEFDHRLRVNNYKIVQVKDVELEHRIGNPVRVELLGREFYYSSHNAKRIYYIIRNRIYVDYKHYRRLTKKGFISVLHIFLNIILFEDGSKKEKLKCAISGVKAALEDIPCKNV